MHAQQDKRGLRRALGASGIAVLLATPPACGDGGDGAATGPHFTAKAGTPPTLTVIKPPVYIDTGWVAPAFEVAEGAGWRRLVDERPADSAYIVGTAVVPARSGRSGCAPLVGGASLSPSADYVKVGMMPPPGAPADAPQLPVIEVRPVTGSVRLRLTFYTDAACTERVEEVIEMEAGS